MAYINRPYGKNYYEVEREVIRDGPYGAYVADYRVDEYGNRIYHHHNRLGNSITKIVTDVIPGHHTSRNGLGNVVTGFVTTDVIPDYHHHHYPNIIDRTRY